MSVSLASQQTGRQGESGSADVRIGCAVVLLLLGVAVWTRLLLPMNTDTSWLMTVADMVLDGKKLYVDVSETNPPASMWIYLPAVALARLLKMAAEPFVIAWIFGLAAASLGVSFRILAMTDWLQRYDRLVLLSFAIVVFTILPGNTFTEREHVATLLCLPFLAATVARAEGCAVSWPLLVAAGLCGGMVASIKPHFVLGLELPVLVALSVRRRWNTLFSIENVIAGMATIAYLASIFVFYPDYWTITVPVNKAIYLPAARQGEALQSTYVLLVAALVLTSWMVLGSRFRQHPAAIVLAAAVGFCIAFIIQGKLWPYQIYPAIALGLTGAALVVMDRTSGHAAGAGTLLGRHWWLAFIFHPIIAMAATVAFCAPGFFIHLRHDRLAEAITRIHPRPTVAVVSGDIALGHPVTRMVNGHWGMTQWALWIETYGLRLRKQFAGRAEFQTMLPAIEAIEKSDMTAFLADLRRNRPDILLTFRSETALRAHIRSFPGIAEELDRYDVAGSVALTDQNEGIVDILRRRPEAQATSGSQL
ncbi:hypothetical protein PY365_13880 [Roseiarcaceae bacterium H3SJ34-1]|uniref:hypothetical protein n=1 Tax=Terripilifer ovatus TaxID=3032367 RepID=UPI003AB94F8A|nr:hypothetical protein [Roseiarcaceae bacterium H3SJ34-1]